MSETDDFAMRFLKANANAGYMGSQLADAVRRIMRASINQDGSQQYEAVQALKHLFELARHAEGVTFYQLVEEAVDRLSVRVDYDRSDYGRVSLAQDATRYLLEMSCDDNAATGRASKRWDAVSRAMKNFAEMQRYRRERANKKPR